MKKNMSSLHIQNRNMYIVLNYIDFIFYFPIIYIRFDSLNKIDIFCYGYITFELNKHYITYIFFFNITYFI